MCINKVNNIFIRYTKYNSLREIKAMAIIKLDESIHPLRNKDDMSVGSAHIDLLVRDTLILKPEEQYSIPADFVIDLPQTEYGLIQPIHSLSESHNLLITSTTLHPGYNGRPQLVICNKGRNRLELKRGEHLAQLIIVQAGSIILK